MSEKVTFRVFRGEPDSDGDPFGKMVDYKVDLDEGMVVVDVIHRIQAEPAPALAGRWNCKAGKCGSCSAEVNGKARLMCICLLYTSPSPRDGLLSRMPSSA